MWDDNFFTKGECQIMLAFLMVGEHGRARTEKCGFFTIWNLLGICRQLLQRWLLTESDIGHFLR